MALGQSPKTEYMWFETALNEAAGKRIAEMRMLLRFMKASSPKYQDAIASLSEAHAARAYPCD